MKIKLIQDNRSNWFIRVSHNHRRTNFSLGTKESDKAKRLFEDISYEVSMINLYTKIMGDLNAIRGEIEKRLQRIAPLIDIKSLITENPYKTEADIERTVYKNLCILGLKPLGKQVMLRGKGDKKGCVVDILALEEYSNKKVVIEVKKIIKESHLGQCLRYLELPDVNMVYLIGGAVDNSVHIFENFNIRIFVIDKQADSSDNPFRPYFNVTKGGVSP